MSNMINIIKRAALDAVQASRPTAVVYGVVRSVDPVEIQIDQKLTLTEDFLVLTQAVKDFEVEVDVDHLTEETSGGSGEALFSSHAHAVTGTKQITVRQAIKPGDKVLMIRAEGGQSYVVIDKVVTA